MLLRDDSDAWDLRIRLSTATCEDTQLALEAAEFNEASEFDILSLKLIGY